MAAVSLLGFAALAPIGCGPDDPDGGGEPRVCGGLLGGSCEADEYCAFDEGDLCGAADATALCTPRPDACAEIFAPVCACDGNTYENACAAARAGFGALHEGPCETGGASCELGGITYPDGTGGTPAADGCNTCSCNDGELACTRRACEEPAGCGGRLGDTCSDEQYCAYEDGDCGFADGTSVCKTRPDVCIDVFDPVCGCDGRTYGNACEAAAAGFGWLHAGPCDNNGPVAQ